ncbi:MAG: DNA topoisomerase IV subunit A, partial [Geminicoccaceae bacterium]|nr:DNA topoisomerase IV subunit A [Geminicoccaceae bacterium]
LSERQAEAVLNLRLRNLRKLEEMELKNEKKALIAERRELRALLGDEGLRRAKLKSEMEEARVAFADPRRTRIAEAPAIDPVLLEQPVERVAMTVICSKKGWIRALRGHQADTSDIRYKDGDGERFIIHTNSADRLLAIADDGRVYLLAVDKLPSGRGMGEPVSLIIDLGKGVDLLALLIHDPAGKVIFATRDGRGFLAEEKEIAAQTRSGKQVVNLGKG